MSIRAKILLGCLSLTLVTIVLGLLARSAQIELGTAAAQIYDEAFMSMNYLRSAQNMLLGVSRDLALPGARPEDLRLRVINATEDVDIAHARAMSTRGRQISARLRPEIAAFGEMIGNTDQRTEVNQLHAIEADFDTAVEIYAGDGYRVRHAVDLLVQRTARRTWLAMGASIAAALCITVMLSQAIVPSVRRAVRIAMSIAEGKLDNDMSGGGRSETGLLLTALSTMQASISQSLIRIQMLMAQQASTHASETSAHHARFEAALNNMTQGLCMFDENGCLQVHNQRFVEMFGQADANGTTLDQLPSALFATQPAGGKIADTWKSVSFTHTLEDGRVIAVAHQAIANGGWVATYEDVSERRRAEARLAHMVRHDALTGLPNRTFFRERIEESTGDQRYGRLAVLTLDLDDFKSVNDLFGHPIGDGLLTIVAQRLLSCVREEDTVVRLGDDEFAVLQVSAEQPTGATILAERIIATLANPFQVDGQQITIGTSIGIVVAGERRPSADALLKNADLALYRAKAEGRGIYRFFEEDMNARMQARRLLEHDLRRAVEDEQFEVHYMPLLSIEHGDVCAFEALARWRHPERGLVSPNEFIPVAEEIGLISRIGAWVMNRACLDAALWPDTVKVAVNLSPIQFRNRELASDIAGALSRSGLPPQRLDVEITESLLLQDSQVVLSILHEIHALGVTISMDDFGTGYSSLSYLRHFPFDKIKIDQSFIRNLSEQPDCIAIVRALIGLGRSLGMAVVAEGVETEEQLELLRQEGCGEAQGYLFSAPKPVSSVMPLIQKFANTLIAA